MSSLELAFLTLFFTFAVTLVKIGISVGKIQGKIDNLEEKIMEISNFLNNRPGSKRRMPPGLS